MCIRGRPLPGTIAWCFPNEKLLWDGPNLRFTDS